LAETARPNLLPARRPLWRRLGLLAGGLLLLLAAVPLSVSLVVEYYRELDLQAALAEADRLDGDWSFEGLQARRQEVSDAENSALRILPLGRWLPNGWDKQAGYKDLDNIAPPVQLSAEQTAALRAALAQRGEAVTPARQLIGLPHGRFPAWSPPNSNGFSLPQLNLVWSVVDLLGYDATLRAQDGDADGALQSVRAALNATRAFGDAPDLTAQGNRLWHRLRVVRRLQRVLAQGEPSETTLAATQELLTDETAKNLLLPGLRSLRAWEHQQLVDLSRRQLQQNVVRRLMWRVPVKPSHAAFIRYMTEAIEIAKLPLEEQGTRAEQLVVPPREEFPFALQAEAVPHFLLSVRLNLAEVRSAEVGMALERYRQTHGHWPDALAELVPAYLPENPPDPFGGKELAFRRLDDGVVVYSVGPNGPLMGGQTGAPVDVPGVDKGFRLWDVDKRRQPPAPPPDGGASPRAR
jgi:hypothetical protein